MKIRRYVAGWMIGILLVSPVAWGETVWVGDFTHDGLAGWESRVFSGETVYQLTGPPGGRVLSAHSQGAASGMFRKVVVDLTRTPYLNWRWKADNILSGNNETVKAGDDYPARIYVVFSGGLMFWKTRALNYVWSSHQPVGSDWPNAFTANAHMVAVESGPKRLGEWVSYQRNIRLDYRRYFGKDIARADAVAIMTDTDNTGQAAVAHYGSLFFSSD